MSTIYRVLLILTALMLVHTLCSPLPVPVLLIHDVAPSRPSWDFWTITPGRLEEIVSAIARLGFRTLDADQVQAYVEGRLPRGQAERALVFTVDDGPASAAGKTAPLLEAHRLRGLFFVVSGWSPPSALSPPELGRLASAGHGIGSHGATHRSLAPSPHPRARPLDDRQLEQELATSRTRLTELSGRPVVALAYPRGEFDERAKRFARAAGYRLAFTTDPGYLTVGCDPFELPRLQVNWNTTAADVEAFLTGPEADRRKLAATWAVLMLLSVAGMLAARPPRRATSDGAQ